MEKVVSGVRPTGPLHLGNYFGAIQNFIKMQDSFDCFFFVADYHSLTTHPRPADLHANVKEVLATYLACGLDPEKTVLYVQSDLPQIPELFLLLCMIAYKGELERCTTFKDKAARQRDNINAGLLTYPVLMTADVIIHKATKVPVGKDQEQHLEMARNFVNRFNMIYGVSYFPEPYGFSYGDNLIKIPGLDGTGKMGKSEGAHNAIFLADEPAVIRKKIMRAVTDDGPKEKNQPKSVPVQNLFTLMQAVSDAETVKHFEEQYNTCTIRYGEMKKKLAEDIITFTEPIREGILAWRQNEAGLSRIVKQGAEKAAQSAAATIKDVREIIGIRSF
ncbi:MAG: tryptophan--tRNA ligase [Chitinophagales bacterium]|nr:MAG: tryptophan--tRNA ligase [Chitinophagales bacterium]